MGIWHKVTGFRGPVEFRDRLPKALTIEAVLEDYRRAPVAGLRILDIGCGNGGISRYFAAQNTVHGVDTKDRRNQAGEPFGFTQVDSEVLPFADGSFDVVLSNHVIEHVPNQHTHLAEIRRVLAAEGVCYLATPNRTSPVMQGHVGNTMVLRYRQMRPLFEASGFTAHEYGAKVLTRPTRYRYPLKVGAVLPLFIAQRLAPWFPSHIFVLAPSGPVR